MTHCPHCGKPITPTDKTCPSCGKGLSGQDLLATPPTGGTGVSTGAIFLILTAGVAALIGLASLSQATAGVGFLAAACVLMIWARIAQAGAHHREVMRR